MKLLLIQAFSLPPDSPGNYRRAGGTKEEALMNHASVAPLLAGVEWDLHPGALAPHGNWPVETREEFAVAGVARLPIVREACESGKYDAIVLLGGGDPGFMEAREIGRRYRIPVTANAHAQMHMAMTLGNRFSFVDISETHNAHMAELVVRYRMADRCASIRNIDYPLPRPAYPAGRATLKGEAERHAAGERSGMLEAAVEAAVAAIAEDGAEVILLGCSAAFWLREPLQARLNEVGWDVPVLEGYRCAIAMAKMLVGLGVDASGITFPGDPPRHRRRRRFV
ncbi:aspartate/glutamate racemase family protein [Siccirubricoccus phaeus]|uniref:aspartate/glutamate racemase family protein n=1 Tax=Siccirubricoccus phaeus TaxID=2595053 RepID=UPI0011F3A9B1|nr:aspartate/glutamate racemase family protein [Siccirubricoccus phaeus]